MASTEVAAIALLFAVHVVGAIVLILGMLNGEPPSRRGWWPTDPGDDGDDPPLGPSAPRGGPDGLPRPEDAQPASTRLREPGRIGRWTAPARRRPHDRPGHEPRPAPSRTGDRDAS